MLCCYLPFVLCIFVREHCAAVGLRRKDREGLVSLFGLVCFFCFTTRVQHSLACTGAVLVLPLPYLATWFLAGSLTCPLSLSLICISCLATIFYCLSVIYIYILYILCQCLSSSWICGSSNAPHVLHAALPSLHALLLLILSFSGLSLWFSMYVKPSGLLYMVLRFHSSLWFGSVDHGLLRCFVFAPCTHYLAEHLTPYHLYPLSPALITPAIAFVRKTPCCRAVPLQPHGILDVFGKHCQTWTCMYGGSSFWISHIIICLYGSDSLFPTTPSLVITFAHGGLWRITMVLVEYLQVAAIPPAAFCLTALVWFGLLPPLPLPGSACAYTTFALPLRGAGSPRAFMRLCSGLTAPFT